MDPLLSESLGNFIDAYRAVTGRGIIEQLEQLASPLKGAKVVHVNAARSGGGVAEILQKLVPFKQALGLDARWEVLQGDPLFFQCVRAFHQGLQGGAPSLTEEMLRRFEAVSAANAERLRPLLEDADFVFMHDAPPAALQAWCPHRRGRWIWRCHSDARQPHRSVWDYLKPWLLPYEASIFSLPEFAQPMPHPQFIVAPSIDPLSEKNRDLSADEVREVDARFGFDPDLPLVLQVARFDRFKDPLGVINAFRMAARLTPLQLVLAGGEPAGDPEEEAVLREVLSTAEGDERIHVLPLPLHSDRVVNALQRRADIVVQKSLREGFGLALAEGMWKGKPAIGGDTGGIRLQVFDHFTGYLVRTPEGAALRIRYLLHREDLRRQLGERARRFIWENFLLTRHLREYLALMVGLLHGGAERIEVGR